MALTRRRLLRNLLTPGAFAAGAGGVEAVRKAHDYIEQQETWDEASRPNAEFFTRHEADLSRLTLGGSFAPEQWSTKGPATADAMAGLDTAVRELGIRQLRLGLRWNRIGWNGDEIDLTSYAPVLEYCFGAGIDVCLDIGPIRVFRSPEEHYPRTLEDLPPRDSVIQSDDAIAKQGLAYLSRLFDALKREYGSALRSVSAYQLENEPYYPLGAHRWQMSQPYMGSVAGRILEAFPDAKLLVTSAGRLNLDSIQTLFEALLRERPELRGRLISGFDFHYRTPMRQSYPLIRYLDQVGYATPFAPSLSQAIWQSRDYGYAIEVTEGQMEPFAQFPQPGNSARDLRFLILRCLDKVLDPQRPGLIRLWGIEELTKRMLSGRLTSEHRDIIEIIRRVNHASVSPLGA
jgi:hypothetical protein